VSKDRDLTLVFETFDRVTVLEIVVAVVVNWGDLRKENCRLLILEVERDDKIKGEQQSSSFIRRGSGGSRVMALFVLLSPEFRLRAGFSES